MRIAMIGLKGVPARYGGVEKHTEELATRLTARGHKVTVYCRSHYTDVSKDLKGVRIVRLPSIRQKGLETITHTFFSLIHLFLSKIKVDIIHIESVDPAIFSPLARLKAKIVVTSHGQVYRQSGKWGKLAKLFSKVAEIVYAVLPKERISVSKTLKEYYEKKYSCDVTYIPNGVSVKTINSTSAIEKLGLSSNKYILSVGRIVPTKGYNFLIEAYKKITADKKLVIVGGGSYTDKYIEQLKNMANEDTMFLGYRYGKELEELYANAYCCIVPSEIEGLAIVLLEAMSHGKCVIYSDIPENAEAAEGVGISFRNGDINDLASKIRLVLENPSYCQELGTKARERMKREYNWDKIVDQTEEVYHSLFR